MKKFIALILAVLMVISLAACGNSDAPEQASSGNEQVKSSNTESENDNSFDPHEITLDNLMKAPESSESDFECVDHDNGDVELLRYLGSSEIVVIPETWNGKEITTIASYVFANDSPVKAIRLSDSITNLKEGSFGLNESLEIVVCGEGLEEIGKGAFQNCTNLQEIVLNDGLRKIDNFSLSGSDRLMSVEIPSSVTEINYAAFYIVPEGFTIIGETGSYAEEFATSQGIKFQSK